MTGNGGSVDILKVMKALTDAIRDLVGRTDQQETKSAKLEGELEDIQRRLREIERKQEER